MICLVEGCYDWRYGFVIGYEGGGCMGCSLVWGYCEEVIMCWRGIWEGGWYMLYVWFGVLFCEWM